MDDDSVVKIFGDIERQVRSIMNAKETEEPAANKLKQTISRNLEITGKFLRDFEFEEDSRTQAKLLPVSEDYLKKLHKNILDASQYDVFGSVDVAQISANIDQLIERLG